MKEFLKKYFTLIVFIIMLISLMSMCGIARRLDSVDTTNKSIKDSTYTKSEINLIIKIEGLKAEKRMIQATDRRMLDVNRQTEIDKEINELSQKLK